MDGCVVSLYLLISIRICADVIVSLGDRFIGINRFFLLLFVNKCSATCSMVSGVVDKYVLFN